jgi:hypothetical protein
MGIHILRREISHLHPEQGSHQTVCPPLNPHRPSSSPISFEWMDEGSSIKANTESPLCPPQWCPRFIATRCRSRQSKITSCNGVRSCRRSERCEDFRHDAPAESPPPFHPPPHQQKRMLLPQHREDQSEGILNREGKKFVGGGGTLVSDTVLLRLLFGISSSLLRFSVSSPPQPASALQTLVQRCSARETLSVPKIFQIDRRGRRIPHPSTSENVGCTPCFRRGCPQRGGRHQGVYRLRPSIPVEFCRYSAA